MDKNKDDVIDGFSDNTKGKPTVDPADVGGERKRDPMSPDEFAKAKKDVTKPEHSKGKKG